MTSNIHPWRRLRRSWLVFAEHFARESGMYRLIDWLAQMLPAPAPLIVHASESEMAALQECADLHGITDYGTDRHALFEDMAERGLVKEIMTCPSGVAWKLTGDGWAMLRAGEE